MNFEFVVITLLLIIFILLFFLIIKSSKKIENSGGIILEGVCFYNMHAREIGEANGWKRLMSNSAKIINILEFNLK